MGSRIDNGFGEHRPLGLCVSNLLRWWQLNTSLAEGSAKRSQQTLNIRLGLPSLFQWLQLTTRCPKHVAEGLKTRQQSRSTSCLGCPGGKCYAAPQQGRRAGWVLRTAARPVGQNDSQRSVPDPNAQGCKPLIHWGKPQHETAELRGNKQTHPSSPPLPAGLGSRAHAVRGGEPDYFLAISLNLPHKLRLLPPQRGHIPRP
ncbi:hypothetical protein ILYODFUR_024754 [Ilyodon furcidens]|uniref:Uncharacterized protein n=1 Tax=Ilyodon furcidens TaxID=33524 RepID=A0ABV0TAT0_9TELE